MNDNITQLPPQADLWQQTLSWQPDAAQQARFQQLYELILAGNRHLNLTRITEPSEFWEKHLWDSLSGLAPFWKAQTAATEFSLPTPEEGSESISVIDIGTGAGFPGIPVAIAHPGWTVTLLDSTRKKIAFLDQVVETMAVGNVKTLCGRVEQVGQDPQHRQRYHLAMIRAVGSVSACAEYALPLLQIGGIAILYRGQWSDEEALPLQAALKPLGGRLEIVEQFETPLTQGIRHCLYLRKVKATAPEFPRAVGIPVQKPL